METRFDRYPQRQGITPPGRGGGEASSTGLFGPQIDAPSLHIVPDRSTRQPSLMKGKQCVAHE